jgi:acetyl/propionyl-CoA carboxylase alpha subunit/acetyl-CoA carboxylase carboxyltransferase component
MSRTVQSALLTNNARIAIINRGEAALRFIRAAREYNELYGSSLQTVAFFLEKEENAPFVKLADDAFSLSKTDRYPGKQKTPYLDHELLLEALSKSRCDAVWVGWGFVSEDAVFAEKIAQAGIVFLGPSAAAMSLLGDKIAAKDLAEKANVPILPWSRSPIKDLAHARKIAEDIGYPVIVKAANAGGGRGIRFVKTPDVLEAMLKSAKEETVRITGNDIVFIEALVEKGRHLEVQVLSDLHGNINTFGVRDCSVQRKNQKIIEETPPSGFSAEKIQEMEASAARLIEAAGYTGAGTVEYLYDLNRNQFYFMEVNTRLQVEHPITEILYGIDLVKGQISVAMGKAVDLSERKPSGHVIETRLNAEDPDRDFTPAPGKVEHLKFPSGPGIRVDSGIEQGSEIPPDFDSMVAKVIAYGATREETISRLKRALGELRIRIQNGTTNKAFLLELLSEASVMSGGVHTGYVAELLAERNKIIDEKLLQKALLAGALELYFQHNSDEYINFKGQLSRSGRPRSLPRAEGFKAALSAFGNSYTLLVKSVGNEIFHVEVDGDIIPCSYLLRDDERTLILEGQRHNILMVPRGDVLQCEINGMPVPLESDSGGYVKSPSPAIVLSVNVELGQRVKKGDILVVLEAMKMEMLVEAPSEGRVQELCVAQGEQIAAGRPLVQLDLSEAGEEVEAEALEPVSFSGFSVDTAEEYRILDRELQAFFLGYDCSSSSQKLLDRLVELSVEIGCSSALIKRFIDIVEIYTAVENLFVPKQIETPAFSRPLTYQELLSHYFRRDSDREKGLPEEFISALEKAVLCYDPENLEDDDKTGEALFHIFKSHGKLTEKSTLLRRILFTMEEFAMPQELHDRFYEAIDNITETARYTSPSLVDAALHARYRIVDLFRSTEITSEENRRIEELISRCRDKEQDDAAAEQLIEAGPHAVPALVQAAAGQPEEQKLTELLAQRQNRDRRITESRVFTQEGISLCRVSAETEEGSISNDTAVCSPEQFLQIKDLSSVIKTGEENGEVTFYIFDPTNRPQETIDTLSTRLESAAPVESISVFTIAVIPEATLPEYRSYAPSDGKWKELEMRRNFDPLFYRELRVGRLENFTLRILYRSIGVSLLEATAKTDPKDVRLFALASVTETNPQLSSEEGIEKMEALESVFNEAVFALQAAQSRYKYRLQWNRIIVHNRALLSLRLQQLRDYGMKLASRTEDMEIERFVVYSRRKRWREDVIREIEILFLNVSRDQFFVRSRKPSNEALEALDSYLAKVVRARQRGNIYPYEYIRMITHAGFPLYGNIPRGEFEEFDIEVDDSGAQRFRSVKGRAPGLNESNIVFGIIVSHDPAIPYPLKRVIIIADPTRDLGSLAEGECRRVIAALDTAEAQNIPVEWIPVSSGAKITMDSGTENLDWTAAALKRIIEFTQDGGEINIIVPGINVGAQSYWNAEATMLMHTRGLLIMTEDAAMLLTGKKALDFSGSVSGETNLDIGGVEKIMGPNGQAQVRVRSLSAAYRVLFNHYRYTYPAPKKRYPERLETRDPADRDITAAVYHDPLEQGFSTIGDIFSKEKNPERKKPFDMRQVMKAVIDTDGDYFERWRHMQDADIAVIWETRIGGYAAGLIGIESRNLTRIGAVPFDGPESWSGGTLFPQSSKKVARGINAFSGRLPLVILANLSGFDGSPESLKNLQLEYGAEIGRAIVNFDGPIVFVVTARYHGGAYVVFSKSLNQNLKAAALEGSYASVIGGAPAAAVVFPKMVQKETLSDRRVIEKMDALKKGSCSQKEYDDLYHKVFTEKQTELGQKFDRIHCVERARSVGSIDDIIKASELRPYIIKSIETMTAD